MRSALTAVALAALLAARSGPAATLLYLSGEPGDLVTRGGQRFFTPADGDMTVRSFDGSWVDV